MNNKTYLIIGATSDIANEFINISKQVSFVTISNSVCSNDSKTILKKYRCNLHNIDKFLALLKKIFTEFQINKIICFQGVMPKNEKNFYLHGELLSSLYVNNISYSVLLNFIDKNKNLSINEIVLIGSIAGDRGKSKNPLYDSSKAFLHTIASGYHSRFKRRGINVLLVKPGNVSTKMTKYTDGILWAKPQRIALDILFRLDKNKQIIYSPFWWRYIMLIIIHLPTKLFNFLGLNNANKH